MSGRAWGGDLGRARDLPFPALDVAAGAGGQTPPTFQPSRLIEPTRVRLAEGSGPSARARSYELDASAGSGHAARRRIAGRADPGPRSLTK